MAYTLFGVGIALFVYYAIKKRLGIVFNLSELNITNVLFCVALGITFASLIHVRYMHYDNFSHWGLVVKNMLITDAIPNASSAIIDFKTYPLGSSSFVYYFCRIVGNSEGIMLIGQALIIFACFYAMFGVIRDPKRLMPASLLALCCACMTFYNISIRINNLLVDFLLPLLALTAIAIMVIYRRDFKRAALLSVPVLAMLVATKNSGVFFAAMALAFLLYLAIKARKWSNTKRGKTLLVCVISIALVLLPLIIWNVHTSREFSGVLSKHTMSVDNFNEMYAEKTPEIISQIAKTFADAVFDLNSLATSGILIFNIVALAVYLLARFAAKKKWLLLRALIAIDITIIIYYAGILAMFLFTMPTAEALILAGFERYASSVVIFMIGALDICAVYDIENSFYIQQGEKRDYMAFKSIWTKNIYQTVTMVFAAVMAVIILSEFNGMTVQNEEYAESLPAHVQEVVGDNWDALNENRYLVYATDTDRQISDYYVQYVMRYMLYAPEVDAIFDAETFVNQLKEYDYFILLEPTTDINRFIGQYTQAEDPTGIYPTTLFTQQNQ